MPYKDKDVRRSKAKGYTAIYRAKKKALDDAITIPIRVCKACGVDITHKRLNAIFCSRAHKSIHSNKKRNHAVEYQKNKQIRQAQALKYYYASHEMTKARQRKQQKNRLPLIAAYEAKRRATKKQRTPKWVGTEEQWLINEAYDLSARRTKLFGFSWHVDHIIPIQGKLVSGLHTINNLQVIPGVSNIAKNNRYEIA